jgi:hypothetical protein
MKRPKIIRLHRKEKVINYSPDRYLSDDDFQKQVEAHVEKIKELWKSWYIYRNS